MKTYKIICLIFSLFVISSCEKSLELYPQDKFSESTFFQNAGQFKLFASQFYGGLTQNGAINRDIYGDLVTGETPSTISNGSYFPGPSSTLWEDSYKAIRNTTYLIQKAEASPATLKAEVATYVGEAKFFRAFAYYNLLRDFGGVPIIDKVLLLTDEELLYGERSSREAVADYIIKDLDAAIGLLPLEKSISGNDKGRVSKEAALSLQSRVALFEGTWRKFRGQDGNALLDKATSAASQVIDGNQYSLFDRRDVLGDMSYKYFFILDKVKANTANLTKANQNEYIFTNRFDTDIRRNNIQDVNSLLSATKKVADLFLCSDGLPIEKSLLFKGRQKTTDEYESRDLRMTNVLVKPWTKYWGSFPPEYIRNFANPDAGGNIFTLNFLNSTKTGYFPIKFKPEIAVPYAPDYPIIRLAEVLLNYAEAKFERDGSISDADLDLSINKLRARASMPSLTNAFVSQNGLNMRTEIRRERNIELFLEGFRFDDLRRWKTAEVEMPQPLRGVLWKGTEFSTDPRFSEYNFPQDNDGYIVIEPSEKRTFTEKHYLFPLPTRQILLNPKLKQNPGWE